VIAGGKIKKKKEKKKKNKKRKKNKLTHDNEQLELDFAK
jgi:hypothetical protein